MPGGSFVVFQYELQLASWAFCVFITNTSSGTVHYYWRKTEERVVQVCCRVCFVLYFTHALAAGFRSWLGVFQPVLWMPSMTRASFTGTWSLRTSSSAVPKAATSWPHLPHSYSWRLVCCFFVCSLLYLCFFFWWIETIMKPQNIFICFAKGSNKLTTPPTQLQLKIEVCVFAHFCVCSVLGELNPSFCSIFGKLNPPPSSWNLCFCVHFSLSLHLCVCVCVFLFLSN